MATKKQGHLTTSPEWARHLRPLMRRLFWRGERRAEKQLIAEEEDGASRPPGEAGQGRATEEGDRE